MWAPRRETSRCAKRGYRVATRAWWAGTLGHGWRNAAKREYGVTGGYEESTRCVALKGKWNDEESMG